MDDSGTMAQGMRERLVQQGRVYRDFDGKLVLVVKVKKDLCTWVPVAEAEKTRQITHRDNFVRRFTSLKKRSYRRAA
jgi:hypothetical protein